MGNKPSNSSENTSSKSKPSSKLQPETRQTLENWLGKLPFSLDSSQTEGICNAVRVLEVESPRTLISKGEDAVGIFVVLSGKIEVVSEGEKYVLREVDIGDCFGEVSVMYGTKCTANVRAATRASLLELKAQDALQLFTVPQVPLLEWFVKRKYIDTSGLFEGPRLSQKIALSFFKKVPLLQGWCEDALKHVVKSLKERPITMYQAGSIICHQGVTGWEVYLLIHGRVRFSTKEQELAVFDAGEHGFCFGEEGLFINTKRRSTICALTSCHVIILELENFYDTFKKFPAENSLFQITHTKWKDHVAKRNEDLFDRFEGALDMEILRMALKQTEYFQDCPSGFVYTVALSVVVKEIKEEQAILSHKQYTQGDLLFLLLKGSAMLINDKQNTEDYLDAKQVFSKTSLLPSDAWIKANEVSVVAFFPQTAVTEALHTFPEVNLLA